jgi:hypothetical protein
MTKTKGISPKLAGAIGPPLTAVVTAMILTNTVDRTSLAALASIAIGALLGYHAPAGKPAGGVAPGQLFTGAMRHAATADPDADPALDDPAHPDDEPDIPDAALKGRSKGSERLEDHTGLGDDA